MDNAEAGADMPNIGLLPFEKYYMDKVQKLFCFCYMDKVQKLLINNTSLYIDVSGPEAGEEGGKKWIIVSEDLDYIVIVKAMLEAGFVYDYKPDDDKPFIRSFSLIGAMHWTITHGNVEVLQKLLKVGVDYNDADSKGKTALMRAAGLGGVEVVQALLDAGANHSAVEAGGFTALIWAAFEGHVEAVQALLDAGADHNAADEEGYTSLIFAAYMGHVEVMQALLKVGADHNAADSKG
jgi:ankyrin repeat protein